MLVNTKVFHYIQTIKRKIDAKLNYKNIYSNLQQKTLTWITVLLFSVMFKYSWKKKTLFYC